MAAHTAKASPPSPVLGTLTEVAPRTLPFEPVSPVFVVPVLLLVVGDGLIVPVVLVVLLVPPVLVPVVPFDELVVE